MSQGATTLTYDEPTVMWRMQRGDGLIAHAVIVPTSSGASVVWFVNERALGTRQFDSWDEAIAWSDRLCAQNWSVGWRLMPDV